MSATAFQRMRREAAKKEHEAAKQVDKTKKNKGSKENPKNMK